MPWSVWTCAVIRQSVQNFRELLQFKVVEHLRMNNNGRDSEITSVHMVSHYSRLFGGPFAGHDETHLRELSMRMKDIPQNRRGRPRRGDLAPSGFVYLGQFLDHDLTRDETRLEHASAAPEKTRNFHAPRLNLESVYGGGPKRCPDL